MRRLFKDLIYQKMSEDSKIWVVTADLGFGMWDKIRDDFPDRFINVGAAEQAGMGVCVGLALEKKIPLFYSISTFAVLRPFETIRNYLHYEQVPVKIVGGGRDKEYHIDGYSHWPLENVLMLRNLNIKIYYPEDENVMKNQLDDFLYNKKPSYMSLKR